MAARIPLEWRLRQESFRLQALVVFLELLVHSLCIAASFGGRRAIAPGFGGFEIAWFHTGL